MPLRTAAIASVGLILSLSAALLRADAQAQPPALTPASRLDDILDALDARGENMKDFVASVKLTDKDEGTGNSSEVVGKVFFQRKSDGDGRINVIFNQKIEDEKIRPENHQYVLDGGWLIERDYLKKIETRLQVREAGEKMDPMKLGEGPFPLPIGQKKEDVRKLFDVQKIDSSKDDPPGTIHIQLTPRPGTQFAPKFKTIDVWVDPADAMPRKIQTIDTNPVSARSKATDLTDVKINPGLGDKDFGEEDISGDWTSSTTPLPKK